MGATEAASNIVIAMVNIKALTSPAEIADAYKEIYKAIRNPEA